MRTVHMLFSVLVTLVTVTICNANLFGFHNHHGTASAPSPGHAPSGGSHSSGEEHASVQGHDLEQGRGQVQDRADCINITEAAGQPLGRQYMENSIACGGSYQGEGGVIEAPNFEEMDHRPNYVVCEWRLRIPSGNLRLHFSSFNLRSCRNERLLIFPSLSANRPARRLCGERIPDDYVSPNSHVRIRYVSRQRGSNPNFGITWSVDDQNEAPMNEPISCGGMLTDDRGVIKSPERGESDEYPNNIDCEWRIQVNRGLVKLTFHTFHVEECGGCACDRLEIYDHMEATVPSRTFCGDETPDDVTSLSSQLKIRFRTDRTVTSAGFAIIWTSVGNSVVEPPPSRPDMSCGGDLEGEAGMIRSPNYGSGNYPPNMNCIWHIQIPHGMRLELRFNHFNLEYCFSCGCDKVEVYNSINAMTPISRECGSNLPGGIVLMTRTAKIRFATDDNREASGFEAQYSLSSIEGQEPVEPVEPTSCGGVLTENFGTVQSPNFDVMQDYPDSLDCEWTIFADPSKVVKFTFTAFAVEMCSGCRCDRLEIVDVVPGMTGHTEMFCGTTLPPMYASTSPNVLVKFTTDWSVGARGFQVNYEMIDPNDMPEVAPAPSIPPIYNATCGQQSIQPRNTRVVGGEQAFPNSWPWQVSLRHAQTYRHTCGGSILSERWVLTAAHCLMNGVGPRDIKVIVGDHNLRQRSEVEQEYSVQRIYMHRQFDSNTMDNDIALIKLSRNITFRDEVSPVCLSDMPAPVGMLCTLTGWGDTLGPQDDNILQQVQLETISHQQCRRSDWNGHAITQNMLCAGFQEGGKGPCHGDSGGPFVCKIHDTWRLHGVVSWGYECGGVQQPGVFTRVTRYLSWINTVIGGGSEIPEVGQNECTSVYEPILVTDEFTSPGFSMDQSYPNNAKCAWRIQAPTGQVITLHFESFHVEPDSRCSYDKLTVYNGRDMGAPVLDTLCGARLPDALTGTDSEMYITFVTDASVTGRGFRISYTTGPPVITKPPTPVVIPEAVPVDHNGQCGQQAISPILPATLRIVGGIQALPHSWPWQVSVQAVAYGQGYHFCGGTIIGRRWVVTASHCMSGDDPSNVQVMIREHDLTQTEGMERAIPVAEIIDHPDYNHPVSVNNDIALLRLEEEISFDNYATPACIPQAAAAEGLVCVTTGWGSTNGTGNENLLNQVDVPVLSTDTCNQRGWYDGILTDQMMCAGYPEGNKDSCQGDSGGPLVCLVNGAWYLHGITSWGFGCALPNNPGIYTRVNEFIDWIAFYTDGEVRPTY